MERPLPIAIGNGNIRIGITLATLRGETCNGQITNGIKRSTIALFDFVFSINRIPQNASHTNLLLVLLLVYFGII
jgi:hypothetical protein